MQTQRLRRFALHVLLAWLFALATGVVNACVMQSQFPGEQYAVAHGDYSHATDADHSMAHEADGHDHGSHASKPPCERCCDDRTALPQQPIKLQTDSPSGFWLAAPPAPAVTNLAASQADSRFDISQLRWIATVPIPIAFLRLAL
jgi:hypothetical protein